VGTVTQLRPRTLPVTPPADPVPVVAGFLMRECGWTAQDALTHLAPVGVAAEVAGAILVLEAAGP
jgi:hypothetical protein